GPPGRLRRPQERLHQAHVRVRPRERGRGLAAHRRPPWTGAPGPGRRGGGRCALRHGRDQLRRPAYVPRDVPAAPPAGGLEWQELPSARLPWPAYGASAATGVIGRKIYLFGVADFFPAAGEKNADFHSEAGRGGNAVGRALLV